MPLSFCDLRICENLSTCSRFHSSLSFFFCFDATGHILYTWVQKKRKAHSHCLSIFHLTKCNVCKVFKLHVPWPKKKGSNSSNTQTRVKLNKNRASYQRCCKRKKTFFFVLKTRFSDSISLASVYSLLKFTLWNTDSVRRHFCWTQDTTQEMIKVVISHSSTRNRKTEEKIRRSSTRNWQRTELNEFQINTRIRFVHERPH